MRYRASENIQGAPGLVFRHGAVLHHPVDGRPYDGRRLHRHVPHAEHRLQRRRPRPDRFTGRRVEPALGRLGQVPLEHRQDHAERRRTVPDLVRGPGRLQRIKHRLVLLQPGHPPLICRSRRTRRVERGLGPLQLIGREHELHRREVEVRLTQRCDVHLLQQIQDLVVQARVLPPLHVLQLVVQLLQDRTVLPKGNVATGNSSALMSWYALSRPTFKARAAVATFTVAGSANSSSSPIAPAVPGASPAAS
ncbi:hypothetical protein ACFRMN_01505 [Streptomyces sp. NPDC056835]|uniref:hypothetical protein n=1 Tax=Streptomyces sp. NPDC056835 TaxID=3345956 RepID=UPI0036B2DF69